MSRSHKLSERARRRIIRRAGLCLGCKRKAGATAYCYVCRMRRAAEMKLYHKRRNEQ